MSKDKKSKTPPLEKPRPKLVRNITGAKRLLARYIFLFQQGVVTDQEAKTIGYLLAQYQQLYKAGTLEELAKKIEAIESKLNAPGRILHQ